MQHGYPVLLDLEGRTCVVIARHAAGRGDDAGGAVAERKGEALLQREAKVVVVAPDCTERLARLAADGSIELRRREFRPHDLDGALLALVATDDPAVNAAAATAARQRGVLVNVADAPDLCDFHVPATVQRGPVTIAISTGGCSPALARHLREHIEGIVGEEYGVLAQMLEKLRAEVMHTLPETERRDAWHRAIGGKALKLIRNGDHQAALRALRADLGLPSPE